MAPSSKGMPRTAIAVLEGESQNGDLALGDCLEKRGHDFSQQRLALVFMHIDNLLPMLSYLVLTLGLADVDEVEDVPRIGSSGAGDFLHACSCHFTKL